MQKLSSLIAARIVALGLAIWLQISSAQTGPALWTLDLSKLTLHTNATSPLRIDRRIVIDDRGDLLVLQSSLFRESSAAALALIDGQSGSIRSALDLGEYPGAMVAGQGFELIALHGNSFLLAIGDELRLGRLPQLSFSLTRRLPALKSSDGTEIAPMAPSRYWALRASPSRRFAIISRQGREAAYAYRIDPQTLQADDVIGPEFAVALLEHEVVSHELITGGDAPSSRAVIWKIGQPGKRTLCEGCNLGVVFGADLIALRGHPKISVIDHEGHVQWEMSRNTAFPYVAYAGASTANRFALTYLASTKVPDERIAVVDVDRKSEVLNVDLGAEREVSLVLSPNGKRLAIIERGVVRYYAVP